jgi:hypothetical protein
MAELTGGADKAVVIVDHPSSPTGSCACGAVTYTIQWSDPNNVLTNRASICHCTTCSAWSGGIYTYMEVYPKDGTVRFTGQDDIQIWMSSDFCERAFC